MKYNELMVGCIVIIVGVAVTCGVFIDQQSEETRITVMSDTSINKGDVFKIKLDTSNGKELSDKPMEIIIQGSNENKKILNSTTDNEGIATFNTDDLSPGNYSVECLFKGDRGYKSSNNVIQLEIEEAAVMYDSVDDGSYSKSNLPYEWQKPLEGPVIDVTYGDEYMTVYYKNNYYEKYDKNGVLSSFGHC